MNDINRPLYYQTNKITLKIIMKLEGMKKCLVPHIGDPSYRFEGQIRKVINNLYSTVDSGVIF